MFFLKNKNPFNKDNFNKKTILTFIKNLIIGSTTARKMFRLYFLILIIFSCLLFLPISFQGDFQFVNGHYVFNIKNLYNESPSLTIDFFDILFTAFSAFSDTGLVVAPTYLIFSPFGKVILMFLIQIGGFGIMFFIFLVWKWFMRRDKISINQMLMAQAEKGTTKIGQTSRMLISTSISIIIIEIIFGLFYSLWFLYYPAYLQETSANGFTYDVLSQYNDLYKNPSNSFFAGFFHSVSSINNAGFDIIGSNSLASYKNGWNSIFLLMTTIEFIIGGIGFPILFDIFSKLSIKKKIHYFKKPIVFFKWTIYKYVSVKIVRNKTHKTSLLTKLAISTTTIVSILSIALWFLFETTIVGAGDNLLWNEPVAFGQGEIGYFNKSVQIIFQALSTRSAGYSTIDPEMLNQSTKWLATFLMFIGGAPSSTAGGIRTTTFAIAIITVVFRLIGRNKPSAFKRSFAINDIKQSFIVIFFALFLVSLGGIVLSAAINSGGHNDVFTNSIFDSASAFGTAGLSTLGYYYDVHWFGKLYLMFLMFIGQFGVSSTLLALNKKRIKTNRYSYIEEQVTIS